MTIKINGTNTTAQPSITGPDTDTGLVYGTDEVSIVTGGTEKVKVDSSGNVGIGTTSPNAELHIGGSEPHIDIGPDAGNRAKIGFKSNDIYIGTTSGSGQTIFKNNISSTDDPADSGTERLRIDSSGRLLVGTTSSNYSNTKLLVAGTASNNYITTLNTTQSDGDGQRYSYLHFRGKQSGGEESSLARIGAMHDGTSDDQKGRIVFSTNDGNDGNSPTERMRIRQDGLIAYQQGYTSTTANAANLHIFSDGVFYRSTSSAKYKTQIEDIEQSYSDALLQCRPVWYRSTSPGDNREWGWWGFIAEEVAAIDPRLVQWKTVEISYDENGSTVQTPCDLEPEGVAYDRFVPHLVNLLKQQKEQIETLETQNASLEARLTALEGGA